jgi:2-polyprenyl-3-methyl-5-hydroxy-6-metoxy-1,4-benzoquinol methylase
MENDIFAAYGPFLCGEKWSNGQRFRDLSLSKTVNRIEYLRWRCTGKKVLHMGCLGHAGNFRKSIKNGTWLHGILLNVSELCIGIDVDSSAYNLVQRELGIENIQLLDLSKPLEDKDLDHLCQIQWDLIVCPEVLEHITNHQQFLQNLRRLAHSRTILIITGPNAFRFANFLNALRGFEDLNTDHKYWFTFFTLSRLLTASGWKPSQLVYYSGPIQSHWMRILCKIAARISRTLSNGLIIEASRLD